MYNEMVGHAQVVNYQCPSAIPKETITEKTVYKCAFTLNSHQINTTLSFYPLNSKGAKQDHGISPRWPPSS